jgi:hypothetical protein
MSFGDGLGAIIGAQEGKQDLQAGQDAVNGVSSSFGSSVAPYNSFGQSFMPAASTAADKVTGAAGNVQSYDDFMKNYQASPGAQYDIQQGQEAQDNSAAARGQLLSGTNQRAQSDITQSISNKYANQAYGSYLQGNQQSFGQLTSALGSLFQGIGVGTTATGQQAGVDSAQIGATSSLAQAQAKNDQSKGSGFGSLFSSLPIPGFGS